MENIVNSMQISLDWITNFIGGSGKQGSNIVEPIIEGLTQVISKFTTVMWYTVYMIVGEQFSPSMETFYKMFSAGNVQEGEIAVAPLTETLTIVGFIIAIILFIVSFIMHTSAGANERQGTLFQLFGSFIISFSVITIAKPIMDEAIAFFVKVWNIFIAELIVQDVTPAAPDEVSKMIGGFFDRGGGAAGKIVIPNEFVLIFTIIFMFTIIINLVRLIIEIVERYVVFAVLVLCFPTASGFLATPLTRRIFVSYVQMLLCQVFLLLMNMWFVRGFFLLLNGGCFGDIISTIFVIAYLRVAQRVDMYLGKMGLSVAQTGGNLMDSCLGAVGMLAVGARAVSAGRKSLGAALGSAGVNTGDYKMTGLAAAIAGGNRLQTPVGRVSLFNEGGGVSNAALKGNNHLTDDAGYRKGMQQIYRSGRANTLNQNSVNDKQALLNSLTNGAFNNKLPRDLDLKGITFDKNGGAVISGSFPDGSNVDLRLKQGMDEKGSMGAFDIDGNALSMVRTGKSLLPDEGVNYVKPEDGDSHLTKGETLAGINLANEGIEYQNAATRFQNGIDGGVDVCDTYGHTILHKEPDGTMCYNHGVKISEEQLNNGTLQNIPLKDIRIQNVTSEAVFIEGRNTFGEKINGALVNRATHQNLRGIKVNGTKKTGNYVYTEKKEKRHERKD